MASGFLVSEFLAEALRRPYYMGNMQVTTQYVVERLLIGPHRVMLKRNFDTACWVPPVGSRGSHSIYYGDRMLARVIDFFCKKNEVAIPSEKEFKEKVVADAEADAAKARAAGKAPKKVNVANRVMTERLKWLKKHLSVAYWDLLLEACVKAVVSYGRHERQHARETPKDLKQVQRDLRILGIEFPLFNLFEDARIEHISREELNEPFNWLDIEALAPMDNPWNMFLRCIQLENTPDTEALESDKPFDKGGARTVGHVADSVESYYQRAIVCRTAEHLYPIIKEFLEEFKDDMKIPPSGGGGGAGGSGAPAPGGSGGSEGSEGSEGAEGEGEGAEDEDDSGVGERADDLSVAAEAADKGDDFFSEFEEDAEVVGGTDPEGVAADEKARGKAKGAGGKVSNPSAKTGKGQGTPESVTPSGAGGRGAEKYFLSNHPGTMDDVYKKRVETLTGMLMRLFKTHSLPAATETPGNRMSSRHLARGEIRYLHKKVFGGKGKRKYSVIYDCSSSMRGRPDREGRLFLLALNRLAQRGYLEGSLVLTGWVNNAPAWLSYKFPVKEEILMRINPSHGSEGIQHALEGNLREIMGMDDVFVYTDACICDAPLNRDFFASKRIWPVGLYVGDDSSAEHMAEHFPQNIIKETIEQVVATMLTRNKRVVG